MVFAVAVFFFLMNIEKLLTEFITKEKRTVLSPMRFSITIAAVFTNITIDILSDYYNPNSAFSLPRRISD